MKILSLTKLFLVFLFALSIIGLFTLPYYYFSIMQDIMLNENRYVSSWPVQEEWLYVINFVVKYVTYLLYVYMLFQMLRLTSQLKENFTVTHRTKRHLSIAGVSCLVATGIDIINSHMYLLKSTFNLETNMFIAQSFMQLGPGSSLGLIAFGLLLIVLSKILNQNISLQEEVKYTI